MNDYFNFKLFNEIGMIILIILAIIITILVVIIRCKILNRKIQYLESIGFIRKLWRIAYIGEADYYWKRGIERIEEDEIERMSLKELKKKYK